MGIFPLITLLSRRDKPCNELSEDPSNKFPFTYSPFCLLSCLFKEKKVPTNTTTDSKKFSYHPAYLKIMYSLYFCAKSDYRNLSIRTPCTSHQSQRRTPNTSAHHTFISELPKETQHRQHLDKTILYLHREEAEKVQLQ